MHWIFNDGPDKLDQAIPSDARSSAAQVKFMSPILYPHRKTRKMLQDVIVIDRIGVFRS
jgi:hypothetical protein